MNNDQSKHPNDIPFWRPQDIPPDMTPLHRSELAARIVRVWADYMLSILSKANGHDPHDDRSRDVAGEVS